MPPRTAYTEGIAGCVGEFWTRLLVRHASLPVSLRVPPSSSLRPSPPRVPPPSALAPTSKSPSSPPPRTDAPIVEDRRHGGDLRPVNVPRDLPRDLRRGRCFLPADELRALGLR